MQNAFFRKWLNADDLLGSEKSDTKVVSSIQTMGDRLFKLFRDLNSQSDSQDSTSDDQSKQKPRLFGGPEDVLDHVPDRTVNISDQQPLIALSHPKSPLGSEFDGPSVGNEDENGDPIIVVEMIPDDGDTESSSEGVIVSNEPSPPSSNDVIYGDAGKLAVPLCVTYHQMGLFQMMAG